jgi:hypothetical protein
MVADFVSADYGWLRSLDGTESARVLFKAGKTRSGYFTNEDILEQMAKAMDILTKYYSNEDHVLIFNNATTHLKRPDDALSAHNMTKNPSAKFSVECTAINPETSRPLHTEMGTLLKEKIQMGKGRLPNGAEQDLYFSDDHPKYPGYFKGLSVILEEQGFTGVKGKGSKLTECKGFACKPGVIDCCCQWMLYSQPNFTDVESCLETQCKACGFTVLFLPKFHCELNFIEQCWGCAKWAYRMYPPSSKEVDLEANVLKALESVPRASMRW